MHKNPMKPATQYRQLSAQVVVWHGDEAIAHMRSVVPRPQEYPRQECYDVAVVGAGVVGCALSRELSQYSGLRVLLIEARNDVGEATSKGNAAIVHTGFDAEPGSLESKLVAGAYQLLK